MKWTGKPTIVQVVGYYPPHLGGMERVAETISEQLAGRGYDVRVITSDVGAPAGEEKKTSRLSVKRLKSLEFAHTPWALGLPRALFRLPKHSILHLHLSQAMYPEWVWFVAKLRRQPYVVHFHLDVQPSGLFGKLFLMYKATLYKGAIRHANKVIVFSKEQQDFIHTNYGFSLRDVVIIPNGVDEIYFKKPRLAKTKRTYSLLYAGRLSSQKRVHILIDAVARMKVPVTLTIVGDGEDRADLEQLVRTHKLANVRFEGFKSPAELISYYDSADVLVVSSEREGMSLTVLEALAAGLPIVASNVPGLGDLLSGVGVLVDEPTGQAFAEALDVLLRDPEALVQLSQQGSQAAQAHASAKVTDAVEALYRTILSEVS